MRNLKRILIPATTTVLKVIEAIDASAMQIALVVGDNNRLLGTVTDGDVRRGLLAGVPLESPVERIMNPHPKVARISDSYEAIMNLMRRYRIYHIPIVDDEGSVLGLEILNDMLQTTKRPNPVVLLAGGLGNRLRPLTENCPKPMLKVGGKPILQTILEMLVEHGFEKFFISVNYMADTIKNFFRDGRDWAVDIQYLEEETRLGTAGPVGLLPTKPTDPVLVMNADLLTNINFQQLLDFHTDHNAKATMCVRKYGMQIPYGVVKMDQQQFIGIDEKPTMDFFVNAGIYLLDPSALDLIPKNTMYNMTTLFEQIRERHSEVVVFPIREYWVDIGQIDEFNRASADYKENFE